MKSTIRTLFASALIVSLIAGCQTTGGQQTAGSTPSGQEREGMSRTQKGALIGAAIGSYQDKQERALRERMAGTGVEVVRDGDNITLDMPEAITFGFDSATLNRNAYGVLDRVAETLKEYDQTLIEVAGHTDSVGSEAYNQKLSERRAQAVADYLISRGVSGTRLMVIGAGESHPVASNETEAGRAENRRVELTIVPVRADS
jgi:outer membrane protein OmpA-like peptidoglycan-associated protein